MGNGFYGEPRDGWKCSDVPFDRVLGWHLARYERARLAQEERTGRPAYKYHEPHVTYTPEEVRRIANGEPVNKRKDIVYFITRQGMGGYNFERKESYRAIYIQGDEEHADKTFFIGWYDQEPRETLCWEKPGKVLEV